MSRSEELIKKVSGADCEGCYEVLRQAVDVAYENLPRRLPMHKLVSAVMDRTGSGPTAVPKALSRAGIEIWESGDRNFLEEVFEHRLAKEQKPMPRELIWQLANYLHKPVTYQMWKEEDSGKYCIAAVDPVTGQWLTVVPFRAEQLQLETFIDFLNGVHAPLESFQALFLNSGFQELFS